MTKNILQKYMNIVLHTIHCLGVCDMHKVSETGFASIISDKGMAFSLLDSKYSGTEITSF
jgi:fructose/tagatose bisphosphate aldolase